MGKIEDAIRGRELLGNAILQVLEDDDETDTARAPILVRMMNADQPVGGDDMEYGFSTSHRVRFWRADQANAPLIIFVHGGSWQKGTYIDSIGSAKVGHLNGKGYAFATVDYQLFPAVNVEDQVQEVANALAYLLNHAAVLGIDLKSTVLMGHSSGAHVVALLGTDSKYLDHAGLNLPTLRGIICLDGSYYNAQAELFDSPGPVADNMTAALGTDPMRLRTMSPTFHARPPNASAFLLLHVQRRGDIRQAVEFSAALNAAATSVDLHCFEGYGFEGHVQMLLRLGLAEYPATLIMDKWLSIHAPVSSA